jgi:hypothetical protein
MSKGVVSRARHRVRLVLTDGSATDCDLFLSFNQRVSDLLNDHRLFLPVVTADGETRIISKRTIAEVRILPAQTAAKPKAAASTSELTLEAAASILGVASDAAPETIDAVYLRLLESVSPNPNEDDPRLSEVKEELRIRYLDAYEAIAHARLMREVTEDDASLRRRKSDKAAG